MIYRYRNNQFHHSRKHSPKSRNIHNWFSLTNFLFLLSGWLILVKCRIHLCKMHQRSIMIKCFYLSRILLHNPILERSILILQLFTKKLIMYYYPWAFFIIFFIILVIFWICFLCISFKFFLRYMCCFIVLPLAMAFLYPINYILFKIVEKGVIF